MQRIKLLPSLLVNQIAAGECIARPASVVKELTENSLDAHAKNIEINIEEAGNRLIRVSDDGIGIEREDLQLAITNHATSKLYTQQDLMEIKTLGFRGEALASIASIAHIIISSATKESETGYKLECKNNEILPIKPVGMATGTIIEVNDLFFNIPARRKFLKAKATEMSHITNTVINLAIAAHNVSFKLTHNGRGVFSVAATDDPLLRLQELVGMEDIEFLEVEKSSQNYHLHAYLGLPEYNRSNNKFQYCYINNRFVKDRTALKALQEAYKDYLPSKRYCIAVLYIKLDYSLIDVNVHPAKSEVRHKKSQEIFQLIYTASKQRLQEQNLISNISLNKTIENFTDNHKVAKSTYSKTNKQRDHDSFQYEQYDPSIIKDPSPYLDSTPYIAPESERNQENIIPYEQSIEDRDREQIQSYPGAIKTSNVNFGKEQIQNYSEVKKTNNIKETNINNLTKDDNISTRKSKAGYLQFHNNYIVKESYDGLIIIDQHALHERIIYEKLKRELKKQRVIAQPLLFPDEIRLDPEEMSVFLKWQEEFEKLGIETKQTGPNKIEVKSLPQILGKISGIDIVTDLVNQLLQTQQLKIEDIQEKILATMACKAAIKSGTSLTEEEMNSLLEAKDTAINPFYCPHGRPTILKITLNEIEKYFKRK